MLSHTPETARPRRLHAHAIIIPIGAGLLIGTFFTDLLYLRTLNSQWETFSVWQLTAGLLVAGLAALTLLAEVLFDRVATLASLRFAAVAAAALISLVNAFVHSRDGYTAVAPTGIALSALTTLILIAVGFRGWDLTSTSGAKSGADS